MSTRSGFCNPSNPPDSHARCRKDGCPCEHHTVTDPVAAVRQAVDVLAKALPGLMDDCTDPQALDLADLLAEVRGAREDLHGLERDVEHRAARELLADQVDAEGLHVERYRSTDRKAWDHEQWQRDVRAKALRKHGALKAAAVVTADGEALDVNLYDLLADVQAVHGSAGPKVTGLRQLGLDARDYCETTPGSWHVKVTRVAESPAPEPEAGGEVESCS